MHTFIIYIDRRTVGPVVDVVDHLKLNIIDQVMSHKILVPSASDEARTL